MTVGQPWLWEAEDGSASGKTTVLGYTQPVSSVGNAAEEAGEQGYVWSAVEAKVCVDKGTLLTGHANWALAYEDGAVVQPSSSMYDDFPKPEYPIETTVKAGRCVRGKVVFPVPGSQRPSLVTFSPVGAESATAEWTVSAK
ncbi:hypothetical protein [Streptomyces chrestomyceticus]|uniref:hypothetical protein n=1 Tax=Streptomyces chrestomyceticus TaxID=68185 RepID=UPI00340AE522